VQNQVSSDVVGTENVSQQHEQYCRYEMAGKEGVDSIDCVTQVVKNVGKELHIEDFFVDAGVSGMINELKI
jgi:hypothetical protein